MHDLSNPEPTKLAKAIVWAIVPVLIAIYPPAWAVALASLAPKRK